MFATGLAVGLALSSAKTAATLTGVQLAASYAGGVVAGTAIGLVVVSDPVLYNKVGNVVRFSTGAMLFSPMLAAEDVARRLGADIPKEGVLRNEEGKSIWEIWNESKPLTRAEKQLVSQLV